MDESNAQASSPPPSSPEQLLEVLLSFHDSQEGQGMFQLCQANRDLIVRSFPQWLATPPDVARNADSYHRYMSGMYYISRFMSLAGLDKSLYPLLISTGQTNPFAAWERKLEQSLELMREGRSEEAVLILSDYLIDNRKRTEHGFRHMAATTHFYVSLAYVRLKKYAEAIAHSETSLNITEEIRDHLSFRIRYVKHLMRLHRQVGQLEAAASYADQMAGLLRKFCRDEPQASFYAALAERLRRGDNSALESSS